MSDPAPFLGVLMLDTAFPRIVGDAGNRLSYPFPTRIRIVDGAGSPEVVRGDGPSPDLIAGFVTAAQALEADGAVGIVSTCGFLVHCQAQIAEAVSIPVIVSALSLFPTVQASVGGGHVAIMTASTGSLTGGTLAAAGIAAEDATVIGFDTCTAFASAILSAKADQPDQLDTAAIEAFAIDAATRALAQRPDIRAILLECGNLPPYAAALRVATGLPVFSILDAVTLLWRATETLP